MVLCDKRVLMKLKAKFYRTVVRPTLIYGPECWVVKKSQKTRVQVTEMCMHRYEWGGPGGGGNKKSVNQWELRKGTY